jgi:serine/threonine protein kinase
MVSSGLNAPRAQWEADESGGAVANTCGPHSPCFPAPAVTGPCPEMPRSDLYSLGAMFYDMVTGRLHPVGDDSVAIMGYHAITPALQSRLRGASAGRAAHSNHN